MRNGGSFGMQMRERDRMDTERKKENRRRLTHAEQKRKAAFEAREGELAAQGYAKHDLTIGLAYANVMAFVLGVPLIVVLEIAYFRRNETLSLAIQSGDAVWFLALFAVLIVVHELIHGITWAVFAKAHWRAISFGFIAKYLTPYCTCGEPLKRYQYVIGALMPTILLGVVPCLAAVYNGSMFLFLLGAVMILGGGGDLTIVLKLLQHRTKAADVVYIDHPYQAGVVAFER